MVNYSLSSKTLIILNRFSIFVILDLYCCELLHMNYYKCGKTQKKLVWKCILTVILNKKYNDDMVGNNSASPIDMINPVENKNIEFRQEIYLSIASKLVYPFYSLIEKMLSSLLITQLTCAIITQ